MFHPLARIAIPLTLLAVVAAGCSSSDDTAASSSTSLAPVTTIATTTTTVAPTTTTTVAPTTTEAALEIGNTVNGLPADEALAERRVVAIKIDNHPKARPQSGLADADAVYEILVEGGLTRFIALFHQSDSDYVGPNRSGRPTDSTVITSLNGAPFQISGAQPWVQQIFRKDGINVVYDTGVTTGRISSRSAPQNLYTSSLKIRDWADNKGWPDETPGNLFAYGEPTPAEDEASKIQVEFSDSAPATWAWDGEQYLRFNGTVPHEWVDKEGNRGQVSTDTIVTMKMRRYTKSDPSGQGSSVPAMETVGTGDAFVFFNGEVVGGTWERGSNADLFTLTAADGSEIVLPPGRVWISFVPNTRTITWE
ncbi:MAG: DUF3048 domain-containing protein [Proteobacteria bacterium]|nr:DUF3048 domain-containing protein [Pseudomonadota bacterium]